MLTGDNAATARAVAARLGLDDVRADVLPGEKRDVIRQLHAEGHIVAMNPMMWRMVPFGRSGA